MPRKVKKAPPMPWRADFRNTETLPDIKVVRTGFLFNALALVLALAVVGWVIHEEYEAAAMQAVVEDIQKEIRSKKSAHSAVLRQATEFGRLQQNFAEIQTFTAAPVAADQLLLDLSRVQPPESMLDRIVLVARTSREGNKELFYHELELGGTITASSESTETELIRQFQRAVEALPQIAPKLESSTLRQFSRDPALGIFTYRMVFRFIPGATKVDAPRGKKREG